MQHIFQWPGVWGFLGALIYASSALIVALWGDNPALGNRRKRALAEFALAVVCGPVFAEGVGPSIVRLPILHGLEPRAIFFGIGLASNYLWPIAVRALGRRVEREISQERERPNDPDPH